MTVQEIIDKARRLCHVNSNQYEDADAIIDFNYIYHDLIEAAVNQVSEDYFWDIGYTDFVVNQSEYVVNKLDSTPDLDIKKIQNLSVRYSTDDEYLTPVEYVDREALNKDISWYESNQPKSCPIYFMKDESVFIFPTPDSTITKEDK